VGWARGWLWGSYLFYGGSGDGMVTVDPV